ncbi:hypothetical protein RN629_18280 [Sphingomonadaceae bacterium jetA1]|uniref:hypothetical protein n=1 Tax=Facivitalis istanbulensis TaxID=3075838 RepID=UPI0034790CC4
MPRPKLHHVDGHDHNRAEAAERLRSLVEEVRLVPESGELAIVLRGDLAAMLRFAAGRKNPDFLKETAALEALLGGHERNLARRNAKTPRRELRGCK